MDYFSCETISDVFDTVEKRMADYGVVPVENSTEGAVTFTLDRLTETSLKICAELYIPISNCLLAKTSRDHIEKLYSHPQVLGQCRQWLQREMAGVELIPVASTARAAELASREKNAGALSSHLAAELYGLTVLESDVQDLSGNTTRFLVIGHDENKPSGEDKTSLLFAVQQGFVLGSYLCLANILKLLQCYHSLFLLRLFFLGGRDSTMTKHESSPQAMLITLWLNSKFGFG